MALGLYDCPECTDCETNPLPALENAECITEVVACRSQICTLYLSDADGTTKDPVVSFDPTSASSLEGAISSTAAGGLRCVYGIGDIPKPEDTVKTISKDREIITKRLWTFNFDIDHMSDTNYTFMQFLSACGWSGRVWFSTIGGKIYGGDKGIYMDLKGCTPFGRGDEDCEVGLIEGKWSSLCGPIRSGDDPFYEG